MKIQVRKMKGVRKIMQICADLINNIPGKDDTLAQKLVKAVSVVEIIRKHTQEERSVVDEFVREHKLERREDKQFVNLFWNTPMRDAFTLHEIPLNEGVQIHKMERKDLGSIYFVVYTHGTHSRADQFYHDADFDFETALSRLWDDFEGGINVKLVESPFGVAAAYGALSTPDDPFCGSACKQLERLVAKHAKYRRDKVPRTYLLIGAPGLGKSVLATRAAKEIGTRTLRIDSQSLNHFGTGEMRFMLGGLKPDTLVIDDIDKANTQKGLPTLLTVFEWIKYDHPDVAVIITTNSPKLNPALRRPGRIDEAIWFEQPDEDDRRAILEGYLERFGLEAPKSVVTKLVEGTEGMGASWLKEIALQLRYEHVDDVMEIIENMERLRDCEEEEEATTDKGSNGMGEKDNNESAPMTYRSARLA